MLIPFAVIVPPGSLVVVSRFVVPEQLAAAVLQLPPLRGPHMNAIVPIGVLFGKPSTFPTANSRSVVEKLSPGSPAGGC